MISSNRLSGVLPLLLLPFFHSPNQFDTFFQERLEVSGISFRLDNFASGEKYFIETMMGGCAFLDYDGDGLLDLFFVNGAAIHLEGNEASIDKSDPRYWNRLYRNRGSGRFEDVTQAAGVSGNGYGIGVGVGDYDNDGWPDLYVTNWGRNEFYRNQGDGTFKEVTVEAGLAGGEMSSSAAFFDYDRDGHLDLYVCRDVDWSFQNHKFCGFSEQRDYCDPKHFNGVPDFLFHNNGDGTFTDVSAKMGIALPSGKGLGVAIGDINRDGWIDVYVANDGVPCFLFQNKKGTAFEEVGLYSASALNGDGSTFAGMGVDIADYDNDAWPDIFVTALPLESFVLFRNNRDGTFLDVALPSGVRKASFYLSGWGTKFVDFDNDGWKDLFVANGHPVRYIKEVVRTVDYAQPLLMLKNDQGRFRDVTSDMGTAFTQRWAARGAAFGDYDNDGDTDIVVTVLGEPPLLLENLHGNKNGWVGFGLTGTRGARDAIGARVKVTDDQGGSQVFTLTRTSSYLSSNDPRVLVGLGHRQLSSVEITWPSGQVQKITDLGMNRYHQIKEKN